MKLTDFHVFTRLGIAALVVVLLGGYAVSGLHLAWYYDGRDGRAGLTRDDFIGHYHGVQAPSPLIAALEAGHPDDLPAADRAALLSWLASGADLSPGYDDFDLGDRAPAEIIATSCLSCHARGATGPGAYPQVPLEYFDDIQPIAVATNIQPVPLEILAVSQHTHAPPMALILIVLSVLGSLTRWPRGLMGAVALAGALGLLGDMGSWWLARGDAVWVNVIVVGGFVYGVSTTLLGLAVIADCVLPAKQASS